MEPSSNLSMLAMIQQGWLATYPLIFMSIVSLTGTVTGRGYCLATDDGDVRPLGDAIGVGSMKGHSLNKPVVGIAATPSGNGYWLAAADGGVFAFGDAGFFGSMGGQPLNKPVVGAAATRTGSGYWLTAGDGGVFGEQPFDRFTVAVLHRPDKTPPPRVRIRGGQRVEQPFARFETLTRRSIEPFVDCRHEVPPDRNRSPSDDGRDLCRRHDIAMDPP